MIDTVLSHTDNLDLRMCDTYPKFSASLTYRSNPEHRVYYLTTENYRVVIALKTIELNRQSLNSPSRAQYPTLYIR